jgi:hypothetical protein
VGYPKLAILPILLEEFGYPNLEEVSALGLAGSNRDSFPEVLKICMKNHFQGFITSIDGRPK